MKTRVAVLFGGHAAVFFNIINTHQIDDITVFEKFSVPATHAAVTVDCCIFLCHDGLSFLLSVRAGVLIKILLFSAESPILYSTFLKNARPLMQNINFFPAAQKSLYRFFSHIIRQNIYLLLSTPFRMYTVLLSTFCRPVAEEWRL